MSKWTGKCDFADHCEMFSTPHEIVMKANIYMGNAKVKIIEPRDLIPYYTNLVSMMSSSSEHQEIHLSLNSYIDDEEAGRLSWRVYHVIKAARSCKKSKKEFNLDAIKEHISFDNQTDVWLEIIEIIKKEPDLVKMHLSSDYRKALRELELNIVPNYFSTIHLAEMNRQRVEFLKYTKENGFNDFNEDNEGEFHPLLWRMSWKVKQFEQMKNKYKEA